MSRNEFIPDCDPKIYDKLSKLYNTIEGCRKINSLNEANAALQIFRSIIAKHKLDIDENYFKERKDEEERKSREVKKEFIIRFKQRRVFWKMNLAYVLAKYLRCQCYNSFYKYSYPGMDYKFSVVIIGLPEDIEIVKYLFKSFMVIVEKCVKEYCDEFKKSFKIANGFDPSTRVRASVKNDYIEGFINGLSEAFEEQNKTDDSVALALVTPKEVTKEYEIIKKGFVKEKMSGSIRLRANNQKIYMDGYREGYNTGYNRDRRLES